MVNVKKRSKEYFSEAEYGVKASPRVSTKTSNLARGGGHQPPAGIPELMSVAEAAKTLGVPESDVLQVLEKGELKGKRIGSTWRISRATLAEYLA